MAFTYKTPASTPTVIGSSVHTTENQRALGDLTLTVYSKELMFAAQPILRFDQVATVKTDLTVSPGHTMQMTRYNPLQIGLDLLTEGTAMGKGGVSTSNVSIKVEEHGKALTVTQFGLQTAFDDTMQSMTTLLGRQLAASKDSLYKWTLLGLETNATASLYNTGTALSTIFQNDVASRVLLTGDKYLQVADIRDAATQLQINKAPKFGGDSYVMFCHPAQLKNLRADTAWIEANNYHQLGQMFRGEVGRIEDVRFVSTTMIPEIRQGASGNDIAYWEEGINAFEIDETDTAGNKITATATSVYPGIMVGENCLGIAEAAPVSLRDDGVEDFGRDHSLAWYGVWGCGIIDEQHGIILETN